MSTPESFSTGPSSSDASAGASSTRRVALAASVVALVTLVAVVTLWSTRPDVAYIDSSRLMAQYDGAIDARRQLHERQRQWTGNVQTLQAEVKALGQRITRASLPPSELTASRDSFQAKQKQLAQYQRAVQQKAQDLQKELMQPVYDQLNADLQRFGKEQGYDLLLGTVSGGNILFAADATDATDAFLEYVDNEGRSAAPKGAADSSTTAQASPRP